MSFVTGYSNDKMVKISSNDALGQYLEDKIKEGTNITITKKTSGGVEYLEIEATGGAGSGTSKVKVSATDSTEDYLYGKLAEGSNITLTKNSVGGVETITISATAGDSLPSQTGNNGKFLTTDGSNASWQNTPTEIPTQTGNSGKFLTTNGTTASWDTVPSDLPTQTGNSGSTLITNGTTASWSKDLVAFKRQALADGNFEICQMSPVTSVTVSNPASGTYPKFDTWKVLYAVDGGTNPTVVHSQNALTTGELINSNYCMRIAPNGAGSSYGNASYYKMVNYIYFGTRYLCGDSQTVTLSFKARSSITNKKIGVRLIQNYGTGGSPTADEVLTGATFTLTSSFQTFTVTFTTNTLTGKTFGTDANDDLRIELFTQWGSNYNTSLGAAGAETFVGSGTIDIAQMQLNYGSIALDFLVEPFVDSLFKCVSILEKTFAYDTAPADQANTGGAVRFLTTATSSYHEMGLRTFTREKLFLPALTFYNPGASDANNKIRNTTDSTNHPAYNSAGVCTKLSMIYMVNNSSIAAGKLLITNVVIDCRK